MSLPLLTSLSLEIFVVGGRRTSCLFVCTLFNQVLFMTKSQGFNGSRRRTEVYSIGSCPHRAQGTVSEIHSSPNATDSLKIKAARNEVEGEEGK